ncbi:hypothetical protein ABZE59_021375, partial [Enterobacter cloacae subsp. cloacae]
GGGTRQDGQDQGDGHAMLLVIMILINTNNSRWPKREGNLCFTYSLHSNFLMMIFTLICVHLHRVKRNVAPSN